MSPTPSFFHAERGAHGLAGDPVAAAFIAEEVAPTPGAHRFARGIAAERDRSGTRNHHHAGLAAGRAHQRDQCVVCHQLFFGNEHFIEQKGLVFRAPTKAPAGRGEAQIRDPGADGGGPDASTNCIHELYASLGSADVIAGPAASVSDHAAAFISNQRGGARLSAVNAQKVSPAYHFKLSFF